jgi:Ca2+-binding EF-hand superfamily protein
VLTYKSPKKGKIILTTNNVDKLTEAIKKLRTHLFNIKSYLLKDFRVLDPQSTGIVTIKQMINVLNKYLPNLPFLKIKDRICECDDNEDKAKYETLFDSITLNSKYEAPECINQSYEILKIVFEKIDSDCSGFITLNEFQNACKTVFTSLGIEFSSKEIKNFMNVMDVNKDGRIDLQEFKNAFTITLQDR